MSLLQRLGMSTPAAAGQTLFFIGALALVLGLCLSPALLSIGAALIAFGGLAAFSKETRAGFWKNTPVGLLLGLYGLHLLSGFYTENWGEFGKELTLKLPLVLLPLGFGLAPPLAERKRLWILAAFVLGVTLVSTLTLVNLLQNYEHIAAEAAKSVPIPVVAFNKNLSHIYLSLLMAFAVFVCIFHGWQGKWLIGEKEKWAVYAVGVYLAVCLHLFTTRTGLAAFYCGLGAMVLWLIFSRRQYALGLALVMLAAAAPAAAYRFAPSFRNRIDNTVQDIKVYFGDQNVPETWSITSRICAWQTAWHIFQRNPVWGVGIADSETEMIAQYKKEPFARFFSEKPIFPHNQYIEYALSFGIVGLAFFLAAMTCPLFLRKRHGGGGLYFCFMALSAAAFLSESVLERQIGLSFFVFFYLWFLQKNIGDNVVRLSPIKNE